MKLTAQVRLNPTAEQRQHLLQTLEQANALCNTISEYAWERQVFGAFKLQKLTYHMLRKASGLTAQIVIRCYSKVADAYKKDKKTQRAFNLFGAIAYDSRILHWYTDKERVSIWSVGGRLNIPYSAGERQKELLKHQQGESDLVYSKRRNTFYLLATCDLPDPTEAETEDALGVDLGRTNIAADSDGDVFSNEVIEKNRLKQQRLRNQLQKTGTKSARRHLKKLSGRQHRFQKDVNHCISKRLVLKAKRTKRGIRLEDLTGIRARTRAKSTEERAKQSNWAFRQLKMFISYKAAMYGVRVEYVAPHYTSQRCFACGHIEKGNRRSQSEFLCLACGHQSHADVNAAKNIAVWASVNEPHVSMREGSSSSERTLPSKQVRDKLRGFNRSSS